MGPYRNVLLFAGVALLFVLTGMMQSWNLSLNILNLALLSCCATDRPALRDLAAFGPGRRAACHLTGAAQ